MAAATQSTARWSARRLMALVLVLLTALVAPAAAVSFNGNYLYTGQQGAQTQIDTAHTSTWSITVTSSFVFSGAKLTMKAGSATTVPATFTLYQGATTSGTILCQVTLQRASFFTQFTLTTFPCNPTVTLSPGSYYATLTSTAPDTQSTAYFIKGYQGSAITTGTGQNDQTPGASTTNSAGLYLDKLGDAAAVAGGTQTYTMYIGNSGATNFAAGTTLTLQDQLPAGVTATAVAPNTGLNSASCTPLGVAGALLTCTFQLTAQLAAATVVPPGPSFNITATMPSTPGDVTNFASIDPTGGTTYPAPVNCTLPPCTQQTTTIQASAGPLLSVEKAAPTIVYAGAQMTYTVSIGNVGTGNLAAASTFTVLDQLWPGAAFVSEAPGTGVSAVTCNSAADPLDCSVTLASTLVAGTPASSGAQFTITITAPNTPPLDAFANYVSVSDDGVSPPQAPGVNCTAPDHCASVGTRIGYPGVQLAKTGPATVVAGNTITYTVSLGNSGSGLTIPNGTVVLVDDQLPLSETFLSAAPVTGVSPVNCTTLGSGLVNCAVTLTADLVNGTSTSAGPSFTITATVDPLFVGNATNYAAAAADGVSAPPQPGPTCQSANCGSSTATVLTGASLELAKSGPASVVAGSTFNYTLSLGNGGTGPLAGGTVVTVEDQLPTGATYVSADPGTGVTGVVCTPSGGGLVSCSVTLAADLAAGTLPSAGPEFTITVTAPSTAGPTTNYASVPTDGTSTPPTPGPSCTTANCASANTTATTSPSVVVVKTAPGTAVAGSSVTYTFNLGNLGTADLPIGTVIRLDDQLPAGATYVSAAGVSGVSPVTCTPSGSGLVSCSATLTAALTAGTAAASGPVFTIMATAPSAAGPTTNYAATAEDGTSQPPVPGANCTTANCGSVPTNVTAAPVPSVVLVKGAPGSAVAGSSVTYTFNLGNQGTGDLQVGSVVLLDDQLPAGATYVSSAAVYGLSSLSCIPSGSGLVSCSATLTVALTAGTVAASGPEFTITATAPTAAGSTTNYAAVAQDGTSTPPTPGVNCTTANCYSAVTIITAPSVVVVKSAPSTIVAGSNIAYTFNLGNLGTADLPAGTVILLDDQLPAGATYVSAAGLSGLSPVTCTSSGSGLVSCSVTLTAALTANTAAASGPSFTIIATAPSSTGPTTNYAAVAEDGTSPPPVPDVNCTTPNCDSVPTNVTAAPAPSVVLVKGVPPTVVAGSNVTFTLNLGNQGTANLPVGTVILLDDQLPAGTTFVSAAGVSGLSPVTCTPSGSGLVSCSATLTVALNAGAAASSGPQMSITVTAPSTPGLITNYAAVAEDGTSTPPVPGSNCTTANCGSVSTNVTPSPVPSVVLEKAAPGAAAVGSSVTYTFNLGNLGTGDLPIGTVIRLDDQLPAGATYVSAAGVSGVSPVTCTPSGSGLVSCSATLTAALTAGTVAASGPIFSITATMPTAAGPTTNYASVADDGTSTPPVPAANCTTANCDSVVTSITAPSVVVVKSAPGTAVAGSSVTYTFNLGNLGTGDLPIGTVIRVDDQLPAGATYVSAAGVSGVSPVTCTDSGSGLVSCSATLTAALTAGTAAASGPVFTITATAPTATGTTTNYAAAAEDGTSPPPVPGPNCTTANCDSVVTTITAPSVVLVKSAPGTAAAGSSVTYTFNLGNLGTADLPIGTVVLLDDQLPAGATYVSAAGVSGVSPVTCTPSGSGLVSCSATLTAALTAGTAAASGPVFTITATAPSAGGSTTNYAAVAEDGTSTPPVPGPTCTTANCGSVSTNVTAPSVVVVKGAPSTVVAGSNIAYTFNLGNLGTGDLPIGTVILLDDQLPAGATFVSANGLSGLSPVTCTPSGSGLVSCSATLTAALTAGTAAANGPQFSITATAPPTAGPSTNYAATAEDGTSPPPVPGPNCTTPNCGSVSTNVTPAPAPQVRLSKTGPATIVAGRNVVYTMHLVNNGTAELPAGTVMRVDDQLPANSTYVTAGISTGSSGVSCNSTSTGLVSCWVTLATALAPNRGNEVDFTLTATAPRTTGAVVNYASVAEDGTSDPPTPDSSCIECASSAASVVPAPPPTPTPDPLERKRAAVERLAGVVKAQKDMLGKKVETLKSMPGPAGKADKHAAAPVKTTMKHGADAKVADTKKAVPDKKAAVLTDSKDSKVAATAPKAAPTKQQVTAAAPKAAPKAPAPKQQVTAAAPQAAPAKQHVTAAAHQAAAPKQQVAAAAPKQHGPATPPKAAPKQQPVAAAAVPKQHGVDDIAKAAEAKAAKLAMTSKPTATAKPSSAFMRKLQSTVAALVGR